MTVSGDGPPPFVPFSQGTQPGIENRGRSAENTKGWFLVTTHTDALQDYRGQGCALAAPGRLRRLTFGLGRLKNKSSRPSGRVDFSLCENPKRNQQTYRNGTERIKKKLHCAPRLPLYLFAYI